MAKQKHFDKFLANIEPSTSTITYVSSVQKNIREYLATHPGYKDIHVQTYLSGSYAKNTSIRPKLDESKRDVDIVVETSYKIKHNSTEVLQEIFGILKQKDTYKNAKIQAHSVGVDLKQVSIDIVPLVGSDVGNQFYIGSSAQNKWILTDPKGHINWSSEINHKNNKKYKPLVKMLKWWRQTSCPKDSKYPKGIALEKIIADNLPDPTLNTENHLIETMQSMVNVLRSHIDAKSKPSVSDPCIVGNDLFSNYDFSDIEAFTQKLSEHLELINEEGTSNSTWRKIFGDEFPKDDFEEKAFTKRAITYSDTEKFIEELFPVEIKYNLSIDCTVTQPGWRPFNLLTLLKSESGGYLRHNGRLNFHICFCDVPSSYSIYWKVRNVGEVAKNRNCIRGQIIKTNCTNHKERTTFYGPHFVECYIIKDDICVARDRIDVPIGRY